MQVGAVTGLAAGAVVSQSGFVAYDQNRNLGFAGGLNRLNKQAPVLVKNLKAVIASRPLSATYHGYTSCPLVTGIGKLVLAEFDYNKQPDETFPIDQSRERWSMWALKRYLLPLMYWHDMLKGRM